MNGSDQITKVQSGVGTALVQDTVETSYNPNGTPEWVEDAKNNRTAYTYDGFDRLEKIAYPSTTTSGTANNSDTETLTYDANGNVTTVANRDGAVITYTYDALNRVTKKDLRYRADLPSAHRRDVYFSYDLRGRPISARFDSTSGVGVVHTYDALDRLTSETQSSDGNTRLVSSQYDVSGNRTRITHPDGHYWTYDYDVLNRPTNMRQGALLIGAQHYNNIGLPDRLVWTDSTLSDNSRVNRPGFPGGIFN